MFKSNNKVLIAAAVAVLASYQNVPSVPVTNAVKLNSKSKKMKIQQKKTQQKKTQQKKIQQKKMKAGGSKIPESVEFDGKSVSIFAMDYLSHFEQVDKDGKFKKDKILPQYHEIEGKYDLQVQYELIRNDVFTAKIEELPAKDLEEILKSKDSFIKFLNDKIIKEADVKINQIKKNVAVWMEKMDRSLGAQNVERINRWIEQGGKNNYAENKWWEFPLVDEEEEDIQGFVDEDLKEFRKMNAVEVSKAETTLREYALETGIYPEELVSTYHLDLKSATWKPSEITPTAKQGQGELIFPIIRKLIDEKNPRKFNDKEIVKEYIERVYDFDGEVGYPTEKQKFKIVSGLGRQFGDSASSQNINIRNRDAIIQHLGLKDDNHFEPLPSRPNINHLLKLCRADLLKKIGYSTLKLKYIANLSWTDEDKKVFLDVPFIPGPIIFKAAKEM